VPPLWQGVVSTASVSNFRRRLPRSGGPPVGFGRALQRVQAPLSPNDFPVQHPQAQAVIELSLAPVTIGAKRPAALSIVIRNVGIGLCTNINLRFAMPSGLLMVGGSRRIDLPRLAAGDSHEHSIRVEASSPG